MFEALALLALVGVGYYFSTRPSSQEQEFYFDANSVRWILGTALNVETNASRQTARPVDAELYPTVSAEKRYVYGATRAELLAAIEGFADTHTA